MFFGYIWEKHEKMRPHQGLSSFLNLISACEMLKDQECDELNCVFPKPSACDLIWKFSVEDVIEMKLWQLILCDNLITGFPDILLNIISERVYEVFLERLIFESVDK